MRKRSPIQGSVILLSSHPLSSLPASQASMFSDLRFEIQPAAGGEMKEAEEAHGKEAHKEESGMREIRVSLGLCFAEEAAAAAAAAGKPAVTVSILSSLTERR